MLGAPSIIDADGKTVKLPTQKGLALLAMIACSSKNGLRREEAAATLWSRSPETQARTNLRQALSSIRASFDDPVLQSNGELLNLNREYVALDLDALDTGTIEHGKPIADFGGAFLEGVSTNEKSFEDWLMTRRSGFARTVRDILFDTGTAGLESGDAKRALAAAERILALDPYEEAGMALCLKAYAANGERSRMQIRFDEFERLLKDDLNIDMSADLTSLKARLLRADAQVTSRSPAMSAPTLVVSQFKTLSDDPDHHYFSEGLTEDVVAQLSKFSSRMVVMRQSEFGGPASDQVVSPSKKSDAEYVLTGSLRWLGNRMRLAVELTENSNGSVLWAEKLDRQSSDPFELQDDLSRYLAGAIPYRIEDDVAVKAEKTPIDELQAYELMILGKRLRDTVNLEGNIKARDLLERAVKKDQGLARSHMYLSDSYVVQHWFGLLKARDKEKALYHARRAVALDPLDVHIQDHLGFALHTMGLWDAAEAQIRNALKLANNEIESLAWCGYLLLMLGKHDEAANIIEDVATRRTTLPPTFEWILGQLFSFQGRDEDVIQTLNGASLLNSTGLAFRAGSQARLGMFDEAKFTLNEFKQSIAKDRRLMGLDTSCETVEASLGGLRELWRRPEDWDHIANGLRLAGMPG